MGNNLQRSSLIRWLLSVVVVEGTYIDSANFNKQKSVDFLDTSCLVERKTSIACFGPYAGISFHTLLTASIPWLQPPILVEGDSGGSV